MADRISRVYADRAKAEAAAAELDEAGFGSVLLLHQGSGEAASEAAMARAGIGDARLLAGRIAGGDSVVSVAPSFGGAAKATRILDRHDPVELELGVGEPVYVPRQWEGATPFSNYMGWRLLSDDVRPMERILKKPSLLPSPRYFAERWWGGGLLGKEPTPLSKRFGWRLLLDRATPFSTRMKWDLLTGKATPLSSRFDWKLLATPEPNFSQRFGWRLLTSNSTPFSSWLGLPLLSRPRE
jgi:hypothetical protein